MSPSIPVIAPAFLFDEPQLSGALNELHQLRFIISLQSDGILDHARRPTGVTNAPAP